MAKKSSRINNDYLESLASGFNRYSLQAYVRTVAAKGDLSVEVVDGLSTVDFSKKGVVRVPSIDTAHNIESITRILRIIDAAASTYRYSVDTEFLASKGMNAKDSLLSIAVNILERDRCDFLSCKEFRGDANIIDGYYQIQDQFTGPLSALNEKAREEKDRDTRKAIHVLGALQLLDILFKSEYVISAGELYDKAKKIASDESVKIAEQVFNLVEKEHRSNYLNPRNPTEQSYEIAKRIFQESTGESAEEEEEACKGEQGEPSTYGELSECLGDSKGEGDEGSEIESKYVPETPPPMTKYEEEDKKKNAEIDGSGSGHGMTYGDFSEYASARSFTVADREHITVVDFPKRKVTKGVSNKDPVHELEKVYFGRGAFDNRYKKAVDKLDTGKGLANSVRRLLEINTRSRWQYGKKKGKIHSPNLYRVTMKEAKGFNERVFRAKQERYNLDVAVSLLVDYSGSMSGTKLSHAIQAAYLLQEAVGQSLRVPVEVLGFTEQDCDASTMLVFKGFDDKVSPENLKCYMSAGGNYTVENADGEAIAWAHERVARRKEKRKIQIVFSDGSPACGRRGVVNYTSEVVKGIEEESPVEIYGIGIMDGSVKRFYSNHKVIKDASELESALLDLIKRAIIR